MSFASAFAKIAYYEGGHTVDTGGDTWYGISRDAHPEVAAKNWPPTDKQVQDFYLSEWNDSHASSLPEPADITYFLAYINAGPHRAITLLQRALRANGRPTTEDGVFGPNTLAQLAYVEGQCLMVSLRSEVAGFYRTLVAENPADGLYLRGWLKRAYEETL